MTSAWSTDSHSQAVAFAEQYRDASSTQAEGLTACDKFRDVVGVKIDAQLAQASSDVASVLTSFSTSIDTAKVCCVPYFSLRSFRMHSDLQIMCCDCRLKCLSSRPRCVASSVMQRRA